MKAADIQAQGFDPTYHRAFDRNFIWLFNLAMFATISAALWQWFHTGKRLVAAELLGNALGDEDVGRCLASIAGGVAAHVLAEDGGMDVLRFGTLLEVGIKFGGTAAAPARARCGTRIHRSNRCSCHRPTAAGSRIRASAA